jgi:hypothetical protein
MDVWHGAARLNIRAGQRHILLLIEVLGVAAAQLERSDAAGHVAALSARLAQLGQHSEHLLSIAICIQTAGVLIQIFFSEGVFGELV